jgi:hypothetical protein
VNLWRSHCRWSEWTSHLETSELLCCWRTRSSIPFRMTLWFQSERVEWQRLCTSWKVPHVYLMVARDSFTWFEWLSETDAPLSTKPHEPPELFVVSVIERIPITLPWKPTRYVLDIRPSIGSGWPSTAFCGLVENSFWGDKPHVISHSITATMGSHRREARSGEQYTFVLINSPQSVQQNIERRHRPKKPDLDRSWRIEGKTPDCGHSGVCIFLAITGIQLDSHPLISLRMDRLVPTRSLPHDQTK